MRKPGRSDIVVAVLAVGAVALGALGFAAFADDTANSFLFAAWSLALLALFMLALRLPLRGPARVLSAWAHHRACRRPGYRDRGRCQCRAIPA